MFIEINNYETGQTEPINLYDVAYFYKKDNDDPSNPYVIVYKMVSGITYLEGFASSGDADDKVAELSDSAAGGGLVQKDTYSEFPDTGSKGVIYLAKDTGQTYYWDDATSTYITIGTAGRTGVYSTPEDLPVTIGQTKTINKANLSEVVAPTVDYSEGSEVIGANATHGLIVSSTSSTVTVKTIMDATIDSFKQVASESSLPQIGQENVLYYLQDTDTFRTWDTIAQDYVEPASGGENLNLILNMSRDTANDYGRQTKPLDFGALPVGRTIVHNYQNIPKPAPSLPAKFYYTYKYTNPYTQTEVTVNKYFTIPDETEPLTFIIDKRIDFQELANNFYSEPGHSGVNYNFRGFFSFTMVGKDSTTDHDIIFEAVMTGTSSSFASELFTFVGYYKFKDTFYQSKSAASGGTKLTLVSTGEKYTWNNKQDALVSGTSIKTINSESILGSGNISVPSSTPTIYVSTSASTDVGYSDATAINLNNLSVGKYIYKNYSLRSNFNYSYQFPEKTAITSGISLTNSSYDIIGAAMARADYIEIELYHSISDAVNLPDGTPVGKAVISCYNDGSSSSEYTVNTAQQQTYIWVKGSYNVPAVPTLRFKKLTEFVNTGCIDKTFQTVNTNLSSKLSITDLYVMSGLSEYSNSSTYVVGDYVYYSGLIYQCNTAIPVAEAWDSTHWTQKTYIEYLNNDIVENALNASY